MDDSADGYKKKKIIDSDNGKRVGKQTQAKAGSFRKNFRKN